MVTLSLPVLCGLIGLVVDVGWAYWRKEACQAAANAAALAGAIVAYNASDQTCGNGLTCQTATSCPANPQSTADPVQVACLYATQNGFTDGAKGGRQAVSIAANTTASPVSGTSPGYWITATVSERLPLTFLSVLGAQWTTVKAASVAGSYAQGGGCVYVLNPSQAGAYTQNNGTISTGCAIYVNSSNSKAFTMTNGTINLNNGADLIISGGKNQPGGTINPAGNVLLNQPHISDPFSGLVAPTPSLPCTPDPGSGSPGTIAPGTYCSITINNGAWTLGSGVFILTGGNFKMNNGSVSSAPGGASLYFTGAAGNLNISNGTLNLTAIQSGPTAGIAVWKDGPTASSAQWTNGTINITGVIYMPYTAFVYSNGGVAQQQTIVVDTLTMTNGTFAKNPATSPFFNGGISGGAYLLQ